MRRQQLHMGAVLGLEVSDSGWMVMTWTFSGGTVDAYVDGVLYGSLTSTVAFNIDADLGQSVTIVCSNPELVTIIDMRGAPLQGDSSQFAQFPNLTELYYPDMDPLASFVVDTERLTNPAFPTDLTGWTISGGWAATGSAFVGTADGSNYSLGQDFGLSGVVGGVYDIKYYVSQVSLDGPHVVQLFGSAFPTENISVSVGWHTLTRFANNAAPAKDFNLFLLASSSSGTVTIDLFSVKARVTQVIGGGFDSWTADDPDSWVTTEVGDATGNITENPTGEVQIISTGGNAQIAQGSVFTVGAQHRIEFDITVATGGTIKVGDGASSIFWGVYSATGSELRYGVSADATAIIGRSGSSDMTIDDFAVYLWPAQSIGSIASLATPTIEVIDIDAASGLAWTTGAFDVERAMTNLTLDAMNWTVAEVNALFASLVVANDAGAVNCVVTLLNMLVPTGQGDTDATALAADGWTVTINGSAY